MNDWKQEAIGLRKAFSVVLIIMGLILALPSLFIGYQLMVQESDNIFVAMSGSMEPTFFRGDVIKIDTQVTAEQIIAATKDANPPGDIIVFYRYDEPIVHRAVEKTLNSDGTYSFKTWGDNNGWPDGRLVKESEIIGKLVEINPPFWTYNYLFWAVIFGAGILFFVIGLILFIFTKNK